MLAARSVPHQQKSYLVHHHAVSRAVRPQPRARHHRAASQLGTQLCHHHARCFVCQSQAWRYIALHLTWSLGLSLMGAELSGAFGILSKLRDSFFDRGVHA